MVINIYYSYNHQKSLQNHQNHILLVLEFGVLQICAHHCGTRALNDDPKCAVLIERIVTNFGVDFYRAMFVVNRFYYCKFRIL